MAARAAAGRFGARCQCAAHADAGARASAQRGLRFLAFPPGLLSLLTVFAAVDALCHDAARPAGPAGAPTGLHGFRIGAGDFDLQCATPAAPAGALGTDDPPWPAGEASHAAASQTEL